MAGSTDLTWSIGQSRLMGTVRTNANSDFWDAQTGRSIPFDGRFWSDSPLLLKKTAKNRTIRSSNFSNKILTGRSLPNPSVRATGEIDTLDSVRNIAVC